MYLTKSLSAPTFLFVLVQTLAVALPVEPPVEPPVSIDRGVKCHEISTYTTEYFLEKHIYEPPTSTCLFYTYGLSEHAQNFSRGGGTSMTTIWDIWPCDFYYGNVHDNQNPLRCIFNDFKVRRTYFENMSRAMAKLCSKVFATVMTNDPKSVPKTGIYGQVEEPEVIGGGIDTIIAVDIHGDNVEIIYERPHKAKRNLLDSEKQQPAKRDRPPQCFPAEKLQEWFATVPW